MIRFHCHGCGRSVSTPVPDDTILRAIAWCPECIVELKDQYITAGDARKFRWLIENSSGYDDPENDALVERLRNFDVTKTATSPEVKTEATDAK